MMRTILSKERATQKEGSSGTEKKFYALRKVEVRTKEAKILCFFFSIHTANVVRIIRKMERKPIKNIA
ncbi:ureidoglycolate hydrolase [Parabacteroides sp. PF5-5]|nr:ureidoglycolate hydrolase [Parabacteroides sp. PH5-39]MDH6314982.1 ureidoglycolate hydrolase [Parabacteroides sp. PF5-13]MDH6318319.1 ureidoglycolate hydrolase [Parabacteroides sp. PH5-13]MDH6321748.1 ureidoglycolate hydrolase [Parabacteroides sp. PH5-8]MDH6325872.1 ureidoglycolate hydrolase [Parabacteroides sp. PH5-41]MDH6333672.1 ureidoglycolate hydrolase [Parabacteroides sp. PF5-5]MDH6344737.1 ureidoglycolate hydrolase [Parabacteroides sp. PH5-46]MDH6359993.1 ureidoglycolate hydrolase 